MGLRGGYQPTAGEQFDILDFEFFQGQFAVELPELKTGLMWDASRLSVTGALAVATIPEPATVMLAVFCGVFAVVRFGHGSNRA